MADIETDVNFLFLLSDPLWFESPDQFHATTEYLHAVRGIVPTTWSCSRSGVWWQFTPPDVHLPKDGWKFHVSAVPHNSLDTLRLVAKLCAKRNIAFKFNLDSRMHVFMNSKSADRGSGGKFITIYPTDHGSLGDLAQELFKALEAQDGPYVLSDYKYGSNGTLYYRYGGFHPKQVLTVRGSRLPILEGPKGEVVPDERTAFPTTPPWVSDPFGDSSAEEDETDWDEELYLDNGRFRVIHPIRLSFTGGIYLAKDMENGSEVLVKEARPYTGVDRHGVSAVDRLMKEHHILLALEDRGIAPRPIHHFTDWEHYFTVQEVVQGMPLGRYGVSRTPAYSLDPSEESIRDYYSDFFGIWTGVIDAVSAVHECGIVLGDLSLMNILVDPTTHQIKLIDFEAATRVGQDVSTGIFTHGYSAPDYIAGQPPNYAHDHYSVAAVIFGCLLPVNPLFRLSPIAASRFLSLLESRIGIPTQLKSVLEHALVQDSPRQPDLEDLREALSDKDFRALHPDRPTILRGWLSSTVEQTITCIEQTANYRRRDRVFPADPRVFSSHPASVSHGALGVARALTFLDREISPELSQWIATQMYTSDNVPPGLYLGLAGMAWSLLDLGYAELSKKVLEEAFQSSLRYEEPDIYLGAAGIGLTALHFYLEGQGEHYLTAALEIGDYLLESYEESEHGCFWKTQSAYNSIRLGYARGASGIALFLLYLAELTNSDTYKEVARAGLNFDLAHTVQIAPGVRSIPATSNPDARSVVSQYWRFGSAGVAGAAARFWYLTHCRELEEYMTELTADVARPFAAHPTLFDGLAGMGDHLLDMFFFTGAEHYLTQAQVIADSILCYQIPVETGITFSGNQLLRASNCYGSGSTGIAVFLDRLHNAPDYVPNRNFTLDSHFISGGNGKALASSAPHSDMKAQLRARS